MVVAHARILLPLLAGALASCGGHGGSDPAPLGSLVDSNADADAVSESARPDAAVGVTVTSPEIAANGGVTFALTNDAGGAFKIDATTGVIRLAGKVDYETTPKVSVTARARSADNRNFTERAFAIDVLDSPAPSIEIDFPFPHAGYAHATAAVSGRITHPEPANVTVRAIAGGASIEGAVASDGHYFVRDILVPDGSSLTLTVTASHAGNESATSSVTLGRAPDLTTVEGSIIDEARDRYLLADRYSGTIVAVTRNGYARTVVSGAGRGTGASFDEPVSLALDTDRDVLYVVDNARDAVIGVNPRTGDRMTVSVGGVPSPGVGTGQQLLNANGIVYDASRRRLLVADDGYKQLVAIDPTTGNRTTFSSDAVNFGPRLLFWGSLGMDALRDRLIATSRSTDTQHGIDLSSGVHSVVSDPSLDTPDVSRSFTGISVSAARGVAYLADDFSNAVVRLDLATGARTSVTSSGLTAGAITHPVMGSGPELEWPTDVLYDETLGRLMVMEEGFADPLIAVDETTGNRTLLTNNAVGSGVNFKDPSGIVLAPDARTAYVSDYIADVVVAVNLETGSRQLITGSPTGRGSIATNLLAVALDAAAGKLYVVDSVENSLFDLDIATGARRTISDAVTGAGPLLDNPVDAAVDPSAHIAYVLDARLDALLAIDIASGARRIVATAAGTRGLALDAARGVAYVSGSAAIKRVDLQSGQSSTLYSVGTVGDLQGVALDAVRGRLLVVDRYPLRLAAIDLATGNRTTVSGLSSNNGGVEVGSGPRFGRPTKIDVDQLRQIAYVTDGAYDAVIAVDLASGYRQVVAK